MREILLTQVMYGIPFSHNQSLGGERKNDRPSASHLQSCGGDPVKLMTHELEKEFAKIGRQEGVNDPIVVAKFFNPAGAGTWLATEFDPEERMFFGYVSIFGDHCDEWGYFSLDELESVKGPLGLGIERDLYFERTPISKVCPKAKME